MATVLLSMSCSRCFRSTAISLSVLAFFTSDCSSRAMPSDWWNCCSQLNPSLGAGQRS